jgi:hypothetical protein
MAKCKITTSNLKKLEVACELSNVKIISTVNYGDITQVLLSFKQPEQLIELGSYLSKEIKPAEITKDETVKPSKSEPAKSEPVKPSKSNRK